MITAQIYGFQQAHFIGMYSSEPRLLVFLPSIPTLVFGRGNVSALSLRRTTVIRLHPEEQNMDPRPRIVEKAANPHAKIGLPSLPGERAHNRSSEKGLRATSSACLASFS